MYGCVVRFRNFLFDKGLKRSVRFRVPVVSIGNLTVGGTGKTPHTEYLIRLLKDHCPTAVLSRGYRRQTKGFVEADAGATPAALGDEPFQMHRKFPDVSVAVQESRAEGIDRLLRLHPDLKLVLLDDAYQHRSVSPSLNLLLIDYARPVWNDRLLPLGRLREPASAADRADIVIFTKCPRSLSAGQRAAMTARLRLTRGQRIYFTTLKYGQVTGNGRSVPEGVPVLAVSGIASPTPFEEQVRTLSDRVCCLRFADHHDFKQKDVDRLSRAFAPVKALGGYILTTEKDYVRMSGNPLLRPLMNDIFYLPVEIEFLDGEALFKEEIIRHIDTYPYGLQTD